MKYSLTLLALAGAVLAGESGGWGGNQAGSYGSGGYGEGGSGWGGSSGSGSNWG